MLSLLCFNLGARLTEYTQRRDERDLVLPITVSLERLMRGVTRYSPDLPPTQPVPITGGCVKSEQSRSISLASRSPRSYITSARNSARAEE